MRSKKKGFTLIEMIVALAVTAVIGYLFISIGRDFVRAWDHIGDTVSRETEARAAMDWIARDIESAFFQDGTNVMFAVDMLDDGSNSGKWEASSVGRPTSSGTDTANHEYGWAGCWVRLFTASPTLNAVGYQIIRSTMRETIPPAFTPRYMLYRNAATVRETIDKELDLGNATAYPLGVGDVVNPQRPNILAVNVVDFGVRLYIYEADPTIDYSDVDAPDGLRLIFPANTSSRLETDISLAAAHQGSTFSGNVYGSRYPDVVEIYMRILTERGADLIYEMEEAGDNTFWEEIVANNSRLYRRYIVVRGSSGL
ncbi:MAG TPA: hypothetical protein DIV79_04390 [Opitutae bacterium]|nr:hypothetical protein [Opitutae bacterium]